MIIVKKVIALVSLLVNLNIFFDLLGMYEVQQYTVVDQLHLMQF